MLSVLILKLGRIVRVLLFVAMVSMAAKGAAQDRLRVRGELVAASTEVTPGEEVMLALSMTPDAGWHGYWVNGGDAGFGMELQWTLPKGVSVGAPMYPVPQTYILQGLMNHVYERPYAILIPVKIDKSVAAGAVIPIKADGNWLACSDTICVPQQGSFSVTITAADSTAARDPRFDAWQAKLPTPLNAAATYAIDGEVLSINIPFPAAAPLDQGHFFAETDGLIDYAAPQEFSRNGDVLTITAQAASDAKSGAPLSGVLKIGPDMGLSLTAKPGKAVGSGLAAVDGPIGLLLTFFAALAGGLVLNIMPCVFPILGLKAVSLAKSGQDEGAARRDALAYSGGVIATTMALGAILLLLRAGGEQIGWAFQLQNPAIVFFLLLLMVAITLNLWGVFELPAIGGSGGLRSENQNSFWTGALAAFVATPCTGPFMAAALGAALVIPAPAAMLLFFALGLGIAMPFLALGFMPALRRKLPKPGAWLSTFRRWMAVPMAMTAMALLWLWGQMGGAFWVAIAGIFALCAVLFAAGKRQRMGRSVVIAMYAAAVLFIAAPAAVASIPALTATKLGQDDTAPAFSPARLAKLRAAGTPVFLYFTADWCITCKANEAAVLNRAEMAKAFAVEGVALLRADFTKRDPAIAQFLADRGRAGVPLYLFYPANAGPVELPQILTIDGVKSAIARG